VHARQLGVLDLDAKIPADDTASRALFFRNQGPACMAPKTENDADCSALATKPAKVSGLYPASLQTDPKFCEALEKRPDAQALMAPFVVVKEVEGKLSAVPYHVAFAEDMKAISAELTAAAEGLLDPNEKALQIYVKAAAQAFLDDSWPKADEAWSKMNAENSKFYLRIAPDEVYFEPCSRKAGFHVSFARINQDSLAWQKKLEPVKKDMEAALAKLAGKPYSARNVSFHLPDFIDIILNAGDARDPTGATIGQSLPNWGPVANEGRGRTVAMTNINTDKDSEAAWHAQVESLLCKSIVSEASFDPKYATMSTVLHEAAHNLGPAHEYKVKGKTDDQIFGGPLASTMEELKAQTSALYFADWLVEKKLVEPEAAVKAHVRDVTWAFGHIAQGMTTSEGKPKPYSQLAAIQLGALSKAGVLEWRKDEQAANGKDMGCFHVELSKWKPAVDALAKTVLSIKGSGNKAGALELQKEFVDDAGPWKDARAVIQERWLRAPKASFVYAVRK
jgi:hypothetical protein